MYYADTKMGFTADIKVNPQRRIEKDEALEKWLEDLNKKCQESHEVFNKLSHILDDQDKMKDMKSLVEAIKDDISFETDTIQKYLISKGISLKQYYQVYQLDFPFARNILMPNEAKEKRKTEEKSTENK